MAIQQSVGVDGINAKTDVKVIQAALNLATGNDFKLDKELVIDGVIGRKTNDAISLFQKNIVMLKSPDGRVDAGGRTLLTLKKKITHGLNHNSLKAIMARGSDASITTYLPLLKSEASKYEVNTPLRLSHFLAQVGHESMSFVYTQEVASGAAYEGREDLGNTQKGDGVRFKGRGLIQLTGRSNYESYGKYIGIDLLKKGNEQLVATTPKYALDVSLWFWKMRKLNRHADNDDIRAVTRRVNGIEDRKYYLERAKFFLVK